MRWVLVIGCVVAMRGVVRGEDSVVPAAWPVGEMERMLTPAEPSAEMRAETARILKELSSNDFAVREKASKELADKGVDGFPGLKEAVDGSNDAELKARVGVFFKIGVFVVPANIPTWVVGIVRKYEGERARLLEIRARMPSFGDAQLLTFMSGLNEEGAELFFRIVLPQETDTRFHSLLEEAELKRVRLKAHVAIAGGKLDAAEKMLRESMGKGLEGIEEDWAVLRVLRQGPTLDTEKEVDALQLKPEARTAVAAMLYRAKGDFEHAADLSPRIPNDSWTTSEPMLIETGRWAELAKFVESLPRHDETDNALMMSNLLMGNAKHVNEVIDAEAAKSANGNLAPLYILNGRTEDAIAWSQKSDDQWNAAFHLLCAQLRIREALGTIKDRGTAGMDLPGDLVDVGLPAAALGLLKDVRPEEVFKWPKSWRSYFQYAGALYRAGDLKGSHEWRERGLDNLGPIDAENVRLTEQIRNLDGAMKRLSNNDPARSKLNEELNKVQEGARDPAWAVEGIGFVGPNLPTPLAQESALFWFTEVLPQEKIDLRARYEKAERIAAGTATKQELEKAIDELAGSINPFPVGISEGQYLRKVVEQFHEIHRDDWALELIRHATAATKDPGYWALMGDISLDNGDGKQAADYYRLAAPLNLTDGSLMYRMGLAMSRQKDTEMKGKELMALAPFLVLSDYEQAKALAGVMRRFQGSGIANTWFESFTRRNSRMQVHQLGDSVVIARDTAEARGEISQAFELQKKLMFSMPHPADGRYNVPVSQMLNWAHFYRLEALVAFGRKDWGTVGDALWREMDNGPPDVETMEKVWAGFKGADGAGAGLVLERAIGRVRAVVEDYPEAGMYREELGRLERLR